MKLVLGNNQSDKFITFYRGLQADSKTPFDYVGYRTLLFWFDSISDPRIEVHDTKTGKSLSGYDGVYINNYLSTYELAASMAICCDYLGIHFIDQEMHNPPSLSKLTMHAKMAAAGVSAPKTFGGCKAAILASKPMVTDKLNFPMVLKRADADRGIDNFKMANWPEVVNTLERYSNNTIWILQQLVPSDGFYRINFYNQDPVFSIYRSLDQRPDGDTTRSHFYKPGGGTNAVMVELPELPPSVLKACRASVVAMNRQIAGVDCIYDTVADKAYVLEVNYNPQLVTVKSFKDIRQQAFLDHLDNI